MKAKETTKEKNADVQFVVVGLGNPGKKYEHTRHNVGRLVVEQLAATIVAGAWRRDKRNERSVTQGAVRTAPVTLIVPESYMNRSGIAVRPEQAYFTPQARYIVVHDDIDLPFGAIRVSFNRGAGGHNGVDSLIRTLKTKAFVRVRIGVAPTTASGTIKKPRGEALVERYLLSAFSVTQQRALSNVLTKAVAAIQDVIVHGHTVAMNLHNERNI